MNIYDNGEALQNQSKMSVLQCKVPSTGCQGKICTDVSTLSNYELPRVILCMQILMYVKDRFLTRFIFIELLGLKCVKECCLVLQAF